jgi:uncharacterized protein (DUF983 family)
MSSKKYPAESQMSAKSRIVTGQKKDIKRFRNQSMHSRITLAASVLGNRCPRCRHGRLFMYKNPYRIKNGTKMHQDCPICQQDFQIEPGFYIGALWTSFPIVVLLMAIMAGIFIGILGVQPEWSTAAIAVISLALQPVIIRFGRSVWIHIFVRQQQIHKS